MEPGIKLPLEVTIKPRLPALHFAASVTSAFQGRDRVAATNLGDEVLVSVIWEPDLDAAAEIVRRAFPDEVFWSAPKIHYIFEARILEPILLVEVRTPENWVGNVIGDLMSRRGLMLGQAEDADSFILTAEVPLAELLGYRDTLQRLTMGRGSALATFVRYAPAPPWFDPNEPAAMALRA